MSNRTKVNRTTVPIDSALVETLLAAVDCRKPVAGLTHDFYRYPARFSPQFARAIIESFTKPGDVVVDPFMGGATTLVEARALGRIGIGLDVNELSCFIARVKTTPLTESDETAIRSWMNHTIPALNMRLPAKRPHEWIARSYQRNVGTRQTWPIRKSLELALARMSSLTTAVQQDFVRAVLLRTGQWALDCRVDVPSADRFRQKLKQFLDEMIHAAQEYQRVLDRNDMAHVQRRTPTVILHRSAETIHEEPLVRSYGPPKLIMTSPPYPGVHVLYHRWQILGRRETPAPFWISNTLDGSGSSYYAFGDRKQPNLQNYFATALATFSSLARIAKRDTIIVQMLAFSDASWQLPKYLKTMRQAGLREMKLQGVSVGDDGRLWRMVPNRKWYADQRGSVGAAKEVVLFHCVRS
jgi:DNA methylase